MLTIIVARIMLPVSIMFGASPAKTSTVVIAPGPESIGIARGTIEISSFAWASLRAFSLRKCSCPPLSIVKPMPAIKIPPAMRKASTVIEKKLRIKCPIKVKTIKIIPEVIAARLMSARFFLVDVPLVRLTKIGAVLKGLTIVKSDASAAKKNAMVPPRSIGRNVYVLIYIVCVLSFLQMYL